MKNLTFPLAAVAVMLLSAFTFSSSINWNISDGYEVKFMSKKATGIFSKMSGDVAFDANNLDASSFNVSLDVASINTGNGMQNKHAVSDKWFDAETYPKITFVSKSFSKTGNGYEVVGSLTMHGVTKEFTMPFTFENNVFKSSLKVNRLTYGVGTMKGMSKNVPEFLDVEISVPVSK
ncbi:MAG: YceI family protein [Flavobacteriales bacterium]